MEEEITGENFSEFFKDVRTCTPERGEVMAQYTAVAEFVEGNEKRQIISLLTSTENKMEATSQVMRKLLFASEVDSYKVPRMMAEDMLGGMSEDECASKPYKYTLEMFFYTKSENIPKDDPHWSVISVLNLDEFLDKKDEVVGSRILSKEESEELNLELRKQNENQAAEHGQDQTSSNARVLEVPEVK